MPDEKLKAVETVVSKFSPEALRRPQDFDAKAGVEN